MQNLSKRQWGQSLKLKEAIDLSIEWCIKAREKNVLKSIHPEIFYTYVVDSFTYVDDLGFVGKFFKYSQKDTPNIDRARNILLKCLAAAEKCHYFLCEDYLVSHEPLFFTIPLLDSSLGYGLVYNVENGNKRKTIIVCNKKLDLLSDVSSKIYSFPVIIGEDSFKWYSVKVWSKFKNSNFINPLKDPSSYYDVLNKAKIATTKEELKKYVNILEIPYEIKDLIKPLGIEWSNHVKAWYLPLGFDIDSVNDYINYIKKVKK
jgi:hypothetical protein